MNTFFELLTLLGKDMHQGDEDKDFRIYLDRNELASSPHEYIRITLQHMHQLWVVVQFVKDYSGERRFTVAKSPCYIGVYDDGIWQDTTHTRDFDYILVNDRVRKVIDAEYKRRSKS